MRQAAINRNTLETQINVKINLDGNGDFVSETGVPFLDHMLNQIARHGMIDIDIKANGDLEILSLGSDGTPGGEGEASDIRNTK